MGGDSLLATRLIGELNRRGFSAALGDLFDFPTLAAFAETVRSGDTIGTPGLRHDPTRRYAPFPLTDVQQAYLVGRQPGFALGGIGSHFFVEFEVADLDVARFERAMNRLISRHDTLRAVVRDGMQQVLPQVPDFRLPCHPVTDLDAPEAVALRERLARQVLDPSRWPVFDIQAALVDGGAKASLFVCLDNLMLDGLSMQILLAELEQLYTNPGQSLPELEIGFRDYLEHVQQRPANDVSLAYWARRLDHLPPAPRLPLRCDPGDVGLPRFARLSARLAAPQWEALKARARAEGLTPSALLLSAYAATLSAWAGHDELSLNLTLFDREPLHPQIEQVLGDFTTLLLLAWQPAADWRSSAQGLQQRLRQDLLHRDVSAIQVMRQLARRAGQAAAAMPVVFTSALGFEQDRFLAHASWMKPRWGLSHTPRSGSTTRCTSPRASCASTGITFRSCSNRSRFRPPSTATSPCCSGWRAKTRPGISHCRHWCLAWRECRAAPITYLRLVLSSRQSRPRRCGPMTPWFKHCAGISSRWSGGRSSLASPFSMQVPRP